VGGSGSEHRVRVRNLSSGGMMAEGTAPVQRGIAVTVALRNIGDVEGSVAWVQEDRFGIAFAKPIDPKLARAPVAGSGNDSDTPRFTRTPLSQPKSTGKYRSI
jgi:hypothetical protein